jgi:predicted nucleic acid-binding protein
MEETKTISVEQKQQDFLSILQSIIGVQFWIPEKCVQSIFQREGGVKYVYNVSVMNKPNCVHTIEIHESISNRLLVQLVNNKLKEPVIWHKFFANKDDFKNNIIVVKEFINTLQPY